MAVDLSTRYLGLQLKSPLVLSACTLSQSTDTVRKLVDAGVAAVVVHSLFEEQIVHEQEQIAQVHEFGADSFAEALTYFPEPTEYQVGPGEYLRRIEELKKAVAVPVIGSLNGVSRGGWCRYAKQIEEAGADALELNVYYVPADANLSAADVENRIVELVQAVKESITVPLAVKLSAQFSSPANIVKRVVEAGASGVVLFNRFLQPDIDPETLQVKPHLELSTSAELLLPLRWIAIIHGRVDCSLALTTGIHTGIDLAKALLAGADVGMAASAFYRNGPSHAATMLDQLQQWVEQHEYASVEQMKGSMSQRNCPDPVAFERGNYMKALVSYTGRPI